MTPPQANPRLYSDLADWWPLLSRPEDYAAEATGYRSAIERTARRPVAEVLELGSGGGNTALHLKRHWRMTLTDLSTRMLDVSRRLNPECTHIAGDMRTLRLGRDFDAVFVHDAVMYMATADDLRAAIATAFVHCRPGAAVLLAPDCTRETWTPQTSHGGHDADGRGLRFLEWITDPDPSDTAFDQDMVYLLRGRDGGTRVVHDRHVMGLFPRTTWLDLIRGAGFESVAAQAAPGVPDRFLAVRP